MKPGAQRQREWRDRERLVKAAEAVNALRAFVLRHGLTSPQEELYLAGIVGLLSRPGMRAVRASLLKLGTVTQKSVTRLPRAERDAARILLESQRAGAGAAARRPAGQRHAGKRNKRRPGKGRR